MCTAVTYLTKDFYFGRTLDIEYHFNETVTITPKNFTFNFKKENSIRRNKWYFWYHSTLERSCKLPVFFVDGGKSLCYNDKLIDYGDFLSLLEE